MRRHFLILLLAAAACAQPARELAADTALDESAVVLRVYQDMIACLKRRDIQGALTYFTDEARPRHRKIFNALGESLPSAAAQLGDVQTVTVVSPGLAVILLVREREGGKVAFEVQLTRSAYGDWKIAGM